MKTDKAGTEHNKTAFVVPKEKANEPLRECVRSAINEYLAHHNGHPVEDLYDLVLRELEAPLFDSVMRYTGSNQTRAALVLGISRSTLRKKLAQYDID